MIHVGTTVRVKGSAKTAEVIHITAPRPNQLKERQVTLSKKLSGHREWPESKVERCEPTLNGGW